jgi:hypothetical protein
MAGATGERPSSTSAEHAHAEVSAVAADVCGDPRRGPRSSSWVRWYPPRPRRARRRRETAGSRSSGGGRPGSRRPTCHRGSPVARGPRRGTRRGPGTYGARGERARAGAHRRTTTAACRGRRLAVARPRSSTRRSSRLTPRARGRGWPRRCDSCTGARGALGAIPNGRRSAGRARRRPRAMVVAGATTTPRRRSSVTLEFIPNSFEDGDGPAWSLGARDSARRRGGWRQATDETGGNPSFGRRLVRPLHVAGPRARRCSTWAGSAGLPPGSMVRGVRGKLQFGETNGRTELEARAVRWPRAAGSTSRFTAGSGATAT